MARRMGYKTPINSIKHVIDVSGGTTGGTQSAIELIQATRNPELTSPTNVNVGSTVGSIFISVFVLGTTGGSSGLVDWFFWKNAGNVFAVANIPDPGNTGINSLRRFIFHEEKGLAATQDGTPMVFKGVIKIPPRFRRMGENDKLEIRLLTETGFDAQFCVKAIYKEYQ